MFDPLSIAALLASLMSGPDAGTVALNGTEPEVPSVAVETEASATAVPDGAYAEFYTAAAACAAFLDGGDMAVFEGDDPPRQIIPGAAMSVFYPRVGNDHRFVVSANGVQPEARQCTGTGAASPDWAGFVETELAVLKSVLAQYDLVELKFPGEPVMFADCGRDPASVYFIFSPGGPGGVVFAGNSGEAQAASFCNLYGTKP